MIPRLLSILFLFTATVASAQSDHGVAVTGIGSVSVKPSIAELTFGVSANAEIAGDAITRFEQTRERVVEAIKKLAIPDATLVQQAFTIGLGSGNSTQMMQMRMMHGGTQKTPSQVVLSQPVTVRLDNIDKLSREDVIERLSRIIDTARDLGLSLRSTGGKSAVQFLIADPEKAKADALEAAFADARSRADNIAKRANVKLGAILAIHPHSTPTKKTTTSQQVRYNPWGGAYTMPKNDGTGAFADQEISATVSVRYAIAAP